MINETAYLNSGVVQVRHHNLDEDEISKQDDRLNGMSLYRGGTRETYHNIYEDETLKRHPLVADGRSYSFVVV